MKTVIIGALAFVALAGTAQAQVKVIRGEDKFIYKPVTTVDFGGTPINGDITRPEGMYTLAPPRVKFTSMIKLRANFKPELEDSVKHL